MDLLYNAGIRLYRSAARLAALRSGKVSRMLEGQGHALEDLAEARAKCAPAGFDFWFHAASLGEFEQARPLIEAIRRTHPEMTICLSFFSPSGYEVRKDYPQVDCVVYLPFDTPQRARTFVEAISPRTAIFVKYEFWGNILQALHERNVPTYLVSAIFRPSQSFFKSWGCQFRRMLGFFRHIFVQDEDSKRLLASIGVTNVTVAGDTRFDRVTDIMAAARPLPAVEAWIGESPFTLIVGSSWPEDEKRYIPWLNRHTEVRAIIAPHEFDDGRIQRLAAQFRGKVTLWSQVKDGKAIPEDTKILIIDAFGLLSSLYRFGDAAIIGGGFGAGIHNVNEAAVYGIPVIFGPKHQKFREAADLLACSGGYEYTDSENLGRILDRFALDAKGTPVKDNPERLKAGKAAGEYIRGQLGATRRILSALSV